MKSNLPTPVRENEANNLSANIFFLVIGFFILYIVHELFEFLFKPLRILSQEDLDEKIYKLIEEKRVARKVRSLSFDDPYDPMHQFQLRFVDDRETYKNDKDNNELYFAWFKEWKNGKIIDSELRWAPDILDDEEDIRANFIQYMKIQFALHRKLSFIRRTLFLRTIYKYYPELTPTMKGLEEDLANYQEERGEIDTENNLIKEIQKFGLPEKLAEYLVEKDINAKQLKEEAKLLKRYIEMGHTSEACICIIENKLGEECLGLIDRIINDGLPSRVAVAYIKKQITAEEIVELNQYMCYILKSYQNDAFAIIPGKNKTAYDDLLDTSLSSYKKKNIAHIINQRI